MFMCTLNDYLEGFLSRDLYPKVTYFKGVTIQENNHSGS